MDKGFQEIGHQGNLAEVLIYLLAGDLVFTHDKLRLAVKNGKKKFINSKKQ